MPATLKFFVSAIFLKKKTRTKNFLEWHEWATIRISVGIAIWQCLEKQEDLYEGTGLRGPTKLGSDSMY